MRGRADGCRGRRWWRRGLAPAPAACDTAALAEAKSRALAREAEAAALARLPSFELLHQALRDVVNLRAAEGRNATAPPGVAPRCSRTAWRRRSLHSSSVACG